jgi:hypothetical protein
LDTLVDQLAVLRAKRIAAYPAKELKPFGLDAPAAVFTLKPRDASAKPHTIKIGQRTEAALTVQDRFVQVDNSTAVGVLPGNLAERLLAAPLEFRNRSIASFSDPDKLIVKRGPRTAIFSKMDGSWKMTSPVEADTEQTDLEDFLKALSRLRADKLVAEKPADLKPYGLDKPEARCRVQVGDKEGLDLLIGNREKTEGPAKTGGNSRRYAKLTSVDMVFLLSPELSDKALAEYRNRSVWAPLDAAQVDALAYTAGKNLFVLEKVDTNWQVVGKPDTKVKAEAVKETLDALASLKASRYVTDKSVDLLLYGLEPPQLSVEALTRGGKRVLDIGRMEGGTKSYYARVHEGDEAPVFILSEADANKIVRTLAQFTQEATKSAAAR